VNLDYSKELASKIPDEFVKISESGISSFEAVKELQQYGFQGFLMGEHFMKSENPGLEAQKFIQKMIL
jgi:indole-3-glycerol phosphate synthase